MHLPTFKGASRRLTKIVLVSVVALTLLFGVLAALWARAIVRTGNELISEFAALETAAAQFNERGGSSLSEIRDQAEAVRPSITSFRGQLGPARATEAIFGWVPGIGDAVRAPRLLAAHAESSLGAFVETADGLDSLFALASEFGDDSAGIESHLQAPDTRQRVNAARNSFRQAQVLLASSDEIRAPGWLPWSAPKKAIERLTAAEVRLAGVVEWGDSVVVSLDATVALNEQLAPWKEMVGKPLSEFLQDPEATVTSLRAVERAADDAVEKANLMVSKTPPDAARLPQIERLNRASTGVAELVQKMSRGMADGLEAFTQAWVSLAASKGSILEPGGPMLSLLAPLSERSAQLDHAARDLTDASSMLYEVSDFISTDFTAAAGQRVDRLAKALRVASDMARLYPALMGVEGPKTYLVLGASTDEIRPSGGVITSTWRAEVDRAGIRSIGFRAVTAIDDSAALKDYPKAPEGLAVHMNAGAWYLRDVAWSPDFEQTAVSAAQLYKLGTGEDLDGVILVSQWAVVRLGEVMGEIEVDGQAVPAAALLETIESVTDKYGNSHLDGVINGIIARMTSSFVRERWFELAAAMEEIIARKDLMIALTDPTGQRVVHELGWSGALNSPGSDSFGVFSSNVGWSKVDRNIERYVNYSVELSDTGKATSILRAGFINRSAEDFFDCSRQWNPKYGATYHELKNMCYWNLVRVYLPHDARITKMGSAPLPPGSVAVEAGYMQAGADSISVSVEGDWLVVSALLAVPVGETRELALEYEMPAAAKPIDKGLIEYRLTVPHQAGALTGKLDVEVRLPHGYRLVEAAPVSRPAPAGQVVFSLQDSRDAVISLTAALEDKFATKPAAEGLK